jgi:hypothetical protein
MNCLGLYYGHRGYLGHPAASSGGQGLSGNPGNIEPSLPTANRAATHGMLIGDTGTGAGKLALAAAPSLNRFIDRSNCATFEKLCLGLASY